MFYINVTRNQNNSSVFVIKQIFIDFNELANIINLKTSDELCNDLYNYICI